MKHHPISILSLLLAALCLFACKKDPQPSDPSDKAEYYFQAKVDGKTVSIEFLPTNDVELSSANDLSVDPPYCNYSYGAFIGPDDASKGPIGGISLNQFFIGDCGNESAQFNGLFAAASYPLGNPLSFSKNVEIMFNDDTGAYRSNIGPQSAAHFSITESKAANNALELRQIVTGTFRCTVYDEFGGEKVLTDGEFRLPFSH